MEFFLVNESRFFIICYVLDGDKCVINGFNDIWKFLYVEEFVFYFFQFLLGCWEFDIVEIEIKYRVYNMNDF